VPMRAKPMPGKRLKPRPRKSARKRGYTHRWDQFAKRYLSEHPLCAECKRQGKIRPATCVDHIVPHRGNPALFWAVESNVQALCASCHAEKTARGE